VLPDTVDAAALPASAGQDAVPLQRLPVPDAAGAEPAAGMREMSFPALGGGASPANGNPSQSTRWTASRAASPAAVSPRRAAVVPPARAAAVAAPTPTLQLARTSGSQPAAVAAASPLPLAVSGTRIESAAPPAASPSPAPTVQTSPAPGLPAFTATPVIQRVDGAAPTGASSEGGHTDRELDELARAMFGRLRGQLRAEVITEREARGLSFDAF